MSEEDLAPVYRKFPLRRLDQTVQRFIKVLRIDLERLAKHKYNIEKVNMSSDFLFINNMS